MIQWNPTTLAMVFSTISLASTFAEAATLDNRTTYPKTNHLARALLKRKISESNSHPQVIAAIHDLKGCPGEICGTLAGEAVQPLLAGAAECAQQDMADKIIDIAKTKLDDANVRSKLIELAKTYRQCERNTFPDYSTPSAPDTNSLFCQKPPKNSELRGLVQAQSSNADPNLFFDPKHEGKRIQKGSDPRTQPIGQSAQSDQSTTSLTKTRTNPETGNEEVVEATTGYGANGSTQNPEAKSFGAINDGRNSSSSPASGSHTRLQKSKHRIGRCRPKRRATKHTS